MEEDNIQKTINSFTFFFMTANPGFNISPHFGSEVLLFCSSFWEKTSFMHCIYR